MYIYIMDNCIYIYREREKPASEMLPRLSAQLDTLGKCGTTALTVTTTIQSDLLTIRVYAYVHLNKVDVCVCIYIYNIHIHTYIHAQGSEMLLLVIEVPVPSAASRLYIGKGEPCQHHWRSMT